MGLRGRDCSVCVHPALIEIDQVLLLEANQQTALAARYGLSRNAVWRHANNHLPERLEKGFSLRRIAECKDLGERIELLLLETVDILEDARETRREVTCPACDCAFYVAVNDVRARVAAAAECRQTVELVGRASGQIAGAQVAALLQALGVRDEGELRGLVDQGRARENISHSEAFEDCIALLGLLVREHPAWGEKAHRALGRIAEADIIPDEPANGHGPALQYTNGLAHGAEGP